MLYESHYHTKEGRLVKRWQGSIYLIGHSVGTYDAAAKSTGSSFHIFAKKHSYGYYLCIPAEGIRYKLSELDDTFWNYEQLSGKLSKSDIITIIEGIACLPKLASGLEH
jgi:hypothetical protein